MENSHYVVLAFGILIFLWFYLFGCLILRSSRRYSCNLRSIFDKARATDDIEELRKLLAELRQCHIRNSWFFYSPVQDQAITDYIHFKINTKTQQS